MQQKTYDFVIIGSGFGGSVSSLRLSEKGYSVLVLEQGKRFRDQDFASSNWQFWKYLWLPALRSFGILQISILKGVMVLHGRGVGGGSLGYANVLEVPADEVFDNPAWQTPLDWKTILRPHYVTARRMFGVTTNPFHGDADRVLAGIAQQRGMHDTFRQTEVGVLFAKAGEAEGVEVADPFFEGRGPIRATCRFCGGCMVGCRYNAKNTLPKNYLYLAEQNGVQVQAEKEVRDVRPLPAEQPDGARYEVVFRSSTAWLIKPQRVVRARNVIFSAGVLGTLKLLFRLREETGTLPELSPQLGRLVRTNSEALMGSVGRDDSVNYSQGIAITSIFKADAVTRIEPVRYPEGSSLMRFISAPLIYARGGIWARLVLTLRAFLRHPIDSLRTHVLPGWARRATILLIMQTVDNHMRLKLGRSLYTLFRRGLVAEPDPHKPVQAHIPAGHEVTWDYAQRTGGIPMGSLGENVLNLPTTAHILGGVPFGENASQGVIDLDCQIHHYPGLFVVDGSIVPANPGVNPSLTITALAEYAMSRIPSKREFT